MKRLRNDSMKRHHNGVQSKKYSLLENSSCTTSMLSFLSTRDVYCVTILNKNLNQFKSFLYKQRVWQCYDLRQNLPKNLNNIYQLNMHNDEDISSLTNLKYLSLMGQVKNSILPSNIKEIMCYGQFTRLVEFPSSLTKLDVLMEFHLSFPRIKIHPNMFPLLLTSLSIRLNFDSLTQNLFPNTLINLTLKCEDMEYLEGGVLPPHLESFSLTSAYCGNKSTIFFEDSLPSSLKKLKLRVKMESTNLFLPPNLEIFKIKAGFCHNTISSFPSSLKTICYCGCEAFFQNLKKVDNNIENVEFRKLAVCRNDLHFPSYFKNAQSYDFHFLGIKTKFQNEFNLSTIKYLRLDGAFLDGIKSNVFTLHLKKLCLVAPSYQYVYDLSTCLQLEEADIYIAKSNSFKFPSNLRRLSIHCYIRDHFEFPDLSSLSQLTHLLITTPRKSQFIKTSFFPTNLKLLNLFDSSSCIIVDSILNLKVLTISRGGYQTEDELLSNSKELLSLLTTVEYLGIGINALPLLLSFPKEFIPCLKILFVRDLQATRRKYDFENIQTIPSNEKLWDLV